MKDPKRAFLRHTLATIAYRAAKVERYAPPGFGNFQLGKAARTPVQIVAHMADLFDWALRMAQGNSDWVQSKPQAWRKEVERFHASLLDFDRYLASDAPLSASMSLAVRGAGIVIPSEPGGPRLTVICEGTIVGAPWASGPAPAGGAGREGT